MPNADLSLNECPFGIYIFLLHPSAFKDSTSQMFMKQISLCIFLGTLGQTHRPFFLSST